MARPATSRRGVLPLRRLRALDLIAGSEPDRPAYLSAASGLVRAGDELCVVADDELHLARFPLRTARPGRLQRLFAGDLPDKLRKRKKRKPDLEVLLRLPPRAAWPRGALLALGSGSGAQRCRGALLQIGARGRIAGRPRPVDATALYARLARQFTDLNLEGGWVQGDALNLLQRGNKGGSPNAVLRFALQPFLQSLQREGALPDIDPMSVVAHDLGAIDDVPLCFTDASPLADGGWLFSAVAENVGNSYADGPCLGAAIGRVDARSRIRWIRRVAPLYKIEGICAVVSGGKLRPLLVSDADDPAVAACLLQAEIS